MPRRLAVGSAQDLVQAEHDIRARIGGQELDFAATAAVSSMYRRPARSGSEDEKDQLASLLRRIIRTVEGDQAPAGG